jgi:hypothetical protein
VSIECNTPEHEKVKLLSWVAVTVYPIGMWFFTLALLRKASTAIFSGKTTPFSRSAAFLYKAYTVSTFWWELMEMLRKFLLIGLFVVVEPGTILQVTIGTITSAAYVRISHMTDDAVEGPAVQKSYGVRIASCPLPWTIRLTWRSVGRVSPVQRHSGAGGKLVPAHVLPLLPDLQVRRAHGI